MAARHQVLHVLVNQAVCTQHLADIILRQTVRHKLTAAKGWGAGRRWAAGYSTRGGRQRWLARGGGSSGPQAAGCERRRQAV